MSPRYFRRIESREPEIQKKLRFCGSENEVRSGNRFWNRTRKCTALLRLDGRRARVGCGLHVRRFRRRRCTRTRTATGTRRARKKERARERIRTSRTHLLFLLRPRLLARWITCEEQDNRGVHGSGRLVMQFHPEVCNAKENQRCYCCLNVGIMSLMCLTEQLPLES